MCIYNGLKETRNHLQCNCVTVSMSKNIKKNLSMLIALNCSSKAQKKELLEHLKPNTLEAICECVINNIINKNIKMSDQEEKKINKSWDKI